MYYWNGVIAKTAHGDVNDPPANFFKSPGGHKGEQGMLGHFVARETLKDQFNRGPIDWQYPFNVARNRAMVPRKGLPEMILVYG